MGLKKSYLGKSLNMIIKDVYGGLKTFYHLLSNDVILFYNYVYTHW